MALRPDETARLYAMSCEVIAAYLRHNAVPVAQVPDLIQTVHAALSGMLTGDVSLAELFEPKPKPMTPARIWDSITHDALISFEDGKRYKTLKRHLKALGLTPDAYRAKWGLPPDYPMITVAYSKHRSDLAKEIGLGRPGALAQAAE